MAQSGGLLSSPVALVRSCLALVRFAYQLAKTILFEVGLKTKKGAGAWVALRGCYERFA